MFDMKRFLSDNFQTSGRLVAYVRAFGVEAPGEAATAKWFYRGAVPAEWFAILLVLVELDRGRPVSLTPYMPETEVRPKKGRGRPRQ